MSTLLLCFVGLFLAITATVSIGLAFIVFDLGRMISRDWR